MNFVFTSSLTDMRDERISVVVPCYNEEKTIYGNIYKIFNYLRRNFAVFEIVAVNDGSSDGTVEELKKLAAEIPLRIIDNAENEGKGKAVGDGVLASNYEIVMFLDADLGIPIEEVERFLLEIKKDADLVIASRYAPGVIVRKATPWHRIILGHGFRLIRRLLANSADIRDTQCGFKMFRRTAAMGIFPLLTIKRFAFDVEVLFIAKKLGYKIKEVPITLQNSEESHVRVFEDSANMFFDLLKIRLNDLFGRYRYGQRATEKAYRERG